MTQPVREPGSIAEDGGLPAGSPRSRSLSDRLRSAGLNSWALIGIALVLWAFVKFLIEPLAVVFTPLAIAVIVVYLLNPPVSVLQRWGLPRGIGVLLIWLLFLAALGTAFAFLIPMLGRQIRELIDALPTYAERVVDAWNGFAARRNLDAQITPERVTGFLEDNRSTFLSWVSGLPAFAGQVLHVVVTVLIGLVLSVYLLIDLPKIKRALMNAIPARYHDECQTLGEKVSLAVGGFFRGQLLVALFVGVASAIGLTLIKLPFAIVVGLVAGIFNLVPLIGPSIGAIPAVTLGLLSGEPIRALWAVLVLLAVQQVDNHIISPNVMGRTVRLHPVTVMLSLVVGASIAGIFGMLIVIPIVATAKIVVVHLWTRRHRFGVGEPAAGPVS